MLEPEVPLLLLKVDSEVDHWSHQHLVDDHGDKGVDAHGCGVNPHDSDVQLLELGK